ncbi:MAG: ribonuclease E inhibitor RraB [Fimbriimonadales bacterium]
MANTKRGPGASDGKGRKPGEYSAITVGFSVITLGPEFDEYRRFRDVDHLCIAAESTADDAGVARQRALEVILQLIFEGSISKLEQMQDDMKSSYSRAWNSASTPIQVPIELVCSRDGEFRPRLVALIRRGAAELAAHLDRKRVVVTGPQLQEIMERILQKYLEVPSPLPPTHYEDLRRKHADEPISGPEVVNYYVYFKNKPCAIAFAKSAAVEGLTSEVGKREKEWLCVLSKTVYVNRIDAQETARIERLAEEFDGDFDGWDIGPEPPQVM